VYPLGGGMVPPEDPGEGRTHLAPHPCQVRCALLTAKESGQLSLDGYLPSSWGNQNPRGSSLLPSAAHLTRTTRKLRCIVLLGIFAGSAPAPPVSLGLSDTSAVISTYMDSSHQVRLVLDVPLLGTSFTRASEDQG